MDRDIRIKIANELMRLTEKLLEEDMPPGEKYYKIVVGDGPVYYSPTAMDGVVVVYEEGKWTEVPKVLKEEGYFLCVFDNFKDAWQEVEMIMDVDVKIFECEVDGIVGRNPDPELEPGNVMVERVKLTKMVYDRREDIAEFYEEEYEEENMME